MTAENVIGAVMRQRQVAVVAHGDIPTIRAFQRCIIAASIEEEDRLLTIFEPLTHLFGEERRKYRGSAIFRFFPGHVDHVDEGQLAVVDPFGQLEQAVFALLTVIKAFEGGSGRSQNAESVVQMRPVNSDIPAVVARCFFLFVSGLVFLIDDDQA